jgi:hypothetical protein
LNTIILKTAIFNYQARRIIMPDNRMLGGCGPGSGNNTKDAVCIHTKKVYDACRSKDCLEDLRVYLTCESQAIVDRAINIKPKSAHVLWTYLDIEPVPFNDGYYTVDVKYFYRITAEAFCGVGRPVDIEGLATFDKRVVLFGGEGKTRSFSSQMLLRSDDDRQLRPSTNLPIATVELVDPVVLGVRVVEPHDHFCGCERYCGSGYSEVPEVLGNSFNSPLTPGEGSRRLYVTLGQFSIIRLERDTQLLIPSYDYCIPEKECPAQSDDPCDLFDQFKFPADEFFPSDKGHGDHGKRK